MKEKLFILGKPSLSTAFTFQIEKVGKFNRALNHRVYLQYRQMCRYVPVKMTAEKAKKLILIFRQIREVVKDAVDNLEAIAENALMIFVDDETDRKALPSSVAIENGLLDIKELAKRLGVSPRTISNLQTDGLPVVKLGKRVLFDYQDVLIWAKGKEIKSRRKNNLRVVR